ncbi:MAG: hypothetical protein ACLSTO_11150 [Bilophila wadsworthia]
MKGYKREEEEEEEEEEKKSGGRPFLQNTSGGAPQGPDYGKDNYI